MLKVGIIGIGNTGSQIAALAKERLSIPVCAINSSEKDLGTIPDSIPKKIIALKDGSTQGAGKDRKRAKLYLKDSIESLLQDAEFFSFIDDLDVLYIAGSTGGGTGSGTALLLAEILEKKYQDVKIITIGVLPVNSEAFGSHVNTLDYLKELYTIRPNSTYLLYDNDKVSGPSYQILQKVNSEIVEDIRVMSCFYNYPTKFASIDDEDMKRILNASGRITVTRVEGFSEKDCDQESIEDMIIDNIKRNCHVETQRDKKIKYSGIITNLSDTLTKEFDDNIPKVVDFAGNPINAFSHVCINEDRKQPNNVFYIQSGLSPVTDKINLIEDRIEEINKEQEEAKADAVDFGDKLEEMSAKNAGEDVKKDDAGTKINLTNIFDSFGV